MTVLCLDLGERRTGVAISDPTGCIARPLTTLEGGADVAGLAARLTPLIREHDVGELVVGLPRRLSGAHGPEAERVEKLAPALEASIGIPVRLWDERLTTVEATRRMQEAGMRRSRRKQMVDQVAATLILQGYLDARTDGAP